MNINDYARTKYDGIIKIRNIKEEQFYNEYYSMGKVTSYQETDTFVYYRDDDMRISVKDIIKSSPNIIELIEVGDYVNGMLVTNIWTDKETGNIEFEFNNYESYLYPKSWNYESRVTKYKIKSIVTKEQFESTEYKVGE